MAVLSFEGCLTLSQRLFSDFWTTLQGLFWKTAFAFLLLDACNHCFIWLWPLLFLLIFKLLFKCYVVNLTIFRQGPALESEWRGMGFVHGLFYISFKIWKGLLAFSSFFTEYQSNFWSQQSVMSSMDLPMSVLGADGSPIWELRIS